MFETPTQEEPRLLRALGIVGWSHLEPVVLAALATESPLLLIGPHGSAKTLILTRLAAALGLTYRHYNASLLSFDDLVGFPVPDNGRLVYLQTPRRSGTLSRSCSTKSLAAGRNCRTSCFRSSTRRSSRGSCSRSCVTEALARGAAAQRPAHRPARPRTDRRCGATFAKRRGTGRGRIVTNAAVVLMQEDERFEMPDLEAAYDHAAQVLGSVPGPRKPERPVVRKRKPGTA